MKEIVLSRIDDRLIHGQVATAWLKTLNVNTVVIPDDKLINDTFMQRILKSAAPAGIDVVIDSVDGCIDYLKEDDATKKIFIIAKTPDVFEKLNNNGITINEIVLGNMAKNGKRESFIKQCAATVEEKECFKRMIDSGINIYYQMVPGQAIIKVSDNL